LSLEPIARQLAPGGLVVFGELHGTHEVPAFVAAAAERAAATGPVALALELPDALQPGVDAYLATGDRAALLARPHEFWSWRCGRGGEALFELLARVRALPDARVVCCDGTWPTAQARDAGMAGAILAGIDRWRAAWLVVCGNLHARSDSPQWMAWHLRARHPDLVALDGGSAWVITSADGDGGITKLGRSRGDTRRGVELFAHRDARGFDGVFHVGPLTPSLPVALP